MNNIVEGDVKLSDDKILIGKKLADKLFLKVGDRVNIFSLKMIRYHHQIIYQTFKNLLSAEFLKVA